jgi:hypothetical protein
MTAHEGLLWLQNNLATIRIVYRAGKLCMLITVTDSGDMVTCYIVLQPSNDFVTHYLVPAAVALKKEING